MEVMKEKQSHVVFLCLSGHMSRSRWPGLNPGSISPAVQWRR